MAEKIKPAGATWLNYLLPMRREHRGDLVAGIALASFLVILAKLLLGGSSLIVGGASIMIQPIDITSTIALLTPVVGHIVKGSVESKKNDA